MAGLVGFFGGTFDPPHLGHLILADQARHSLGLSKVLWVVAGDPPHKKTHSLSPGEQRAQLVAAAIADNPHFELSRLDLDRPGPHFTADAVRLLAEREGRVAFIIGSDSLNNLPSWDRPDELLGAVESVGVMQRPGSNPDWDRLQDKLPGLREKVSLFEAPFIGISGVEIRQRIRAGASYRYLVLPRVADLIQELGLYH